MSYKNSELNRIADHFNNVQQDIKKMLIQMKGNTFFLSNGGTYLTNYSFKFQKKLNRFMDTEDEIKLKQDIELYRIVQNIGYDIPHKQFLYPSCTSTDLEYLHEYIKDNPKEDPYIIYHFIVKKGVPVIPLLINETKFMSSFEQDVLIPSYLNFKFCENGTYDIITDDYSYIMEHFKICPDDDLIESDDDDLIESDPDDIYTHQLFDFNKP